MGGLFESKQKTTSQQSTQVPLNFSQLMDRTISFANEGLDTPFQAYNAPRIAELSANEQAGISAAGSQAGMYQPLIDMAMTNNADMQARGGVPTAGDLNQFINPYVDYVLGNSLDRLQEQSDTNMTKIGSTAAMSGAFGGTRHGVLEGANLAELLKSARDMSASTYSDAYDKGMGNWFRSQDLRRGTIRDALDITNQGSNYNRNDINTLMQTGLVGRTRDQSVLDFAFSEFMREQQDPFTKAGFASSILSSYPTNLFTRNSQSETTNTPSPFSQIAGIGMAAAGLMTGNPAAAAGLMSGQQSLGMGSPIGGVDITGPGGLSGSQMSGMSLDDIMAQIRSAKGGGFAKGGKVKQQGVKMEEIVGPLKETPYYKDAKRNVDFDLNDVYDWFMEMLPAYDNLPILYPESKEEARTRRFVNSVGPNIDKRALSRKLLEDRITNSTYGKDPITDNVLDSLALDARNEKNTQALWNNEHASRAHQDLADMSTRTDPLEDFLIPDGDFQRQYTHTLSSGPQGKKKKYAKGGEVKTNFFDGGMAALFGGVFGFGDKPKPQAPVAPPATMVEAFNGPQYQTQGGYRQGTLFGGSILDAITGRGAYSPSERQVRQGSTPAPYTPKPQTPYDWSAFYERQGLNRIPTARSNINPNYASGNRPDLSMFMQALQQRIAGNQPQQAFAKGGPVKRFSEGGKTYLKMKPSTQGVQDLNSLLGFVPTDEVYGGDNTLPISDLLDNERVFKLALQKHESGAKEYDKPNYKARPIDEKGNALSSAFGVGQWILPTWNTLAQKSKGEIPSWTQAKLDKGEFPDQATQEKAWGLWNEMLRNRYGNDYVSRFAAHQVGDAGFDKLRRANPNKLVKDVLGANVARNVSASKETVGEYFNRLNSYVGNARNWEIDRLKAKGGVATDIMRSGNPRLASHNVASNRTQYPQDILEALMEQGGVDSQPFAKKGDMIIPELAASPAGASASARTDDGNYQIEDYQPSNNDRRVSRTTSRQSAPKSFNSPLEVLIGNQKPQDYLEGMVDGVPADAMLPDFTIGGRSSVSQNDIMRMMLESGLDPQPFKKKKQYSGGGYVKKYAKGQIVETDPHAMHSTDEDVLYKFNQGAPSLEDWLSSAWNRIRQPAFGSPPQGNNPQRHISKGNVSPWSNVDMGILTPDAQGTSPEDFNMALENGEPSDIVSQPAQERLQEDGLTLALKQMIMQEIEDRKGRKEPGPPTFFGREINMPLLKMGLGILANSGYPNSAGEAIGKGVLGALNEEEQAQLDKSKRNNDKLKELLNLRYMQGMVESMDPNIKMQLQRERAAQEMTQKALEKQQEYELRMALYEAQRQGKVDDALAIAKGKLQAENEAMFGLGNNDDEGINLD